MVVEAAAAEEEENRAGSDAGVSGAGPAGGRRAAVAAGPAGKVGGVRDACEQSRCPLDATWASGAGRTLLRLVKEQGQPSPRRPPSLILKQGAENPPTHATRPPTCPCTRRGRAVERRPLRPRINRCVVIRRVGLCTWQRGGSGGRRRHQRGPAERALLLVLLAVHGLWPGAARKLPAERLAPELLLLLEALEG